MAEYEAYRRKSFEDPDCNAAFDHAAKTRCIISYERSFPRPVFELSGARQMSLSQPTAG